MDILSVPDSTLRGARSRATVGVIAILFGGLGIVAEVTFYVASRRFDGLMYPGSYIIIQMALGIVNCLLLVVAGVLGICSQRMLRVAIVNMVFNTISAVECVIWALFLGFITSDAWTFHRYGRNSDGFYLVTLSFLDMALLLNFLTAVIGASLACTAICPCVAVNTEGQFLVYNNAFRITPHVPLHDEATSPLMEPNRDPPCGGITSFKPTPYGTA